MDDLKSAPLTRKESDAFKKPPDSDQVSQRSREEYEYWTDYRSELVQRAHTQFDAYAKYVLTLAAGALALSITLLKEITSQSPTAMSYLFLSWAGFILSISAVLGSLLTGYWRHNKAAYLLRDNLESGASYSRMRQGFERVAGRRIFMSLHITSAVCFVIGVLFLCLFAAKNIGQP